MDEARITREATGSYPFHFWIEKALVEESNGQMVVRGIASTGNVDHDKERMSREALKAMVNIINKNGVPLRIEHSQKDSAIVGEVNKAWLDERDQMWIEAPLDPAHVASPILYNAIKAGTNYGLSVGGFVKRAAEEMVEGVGHAVKTFYDIVLDEVSVTQHPSNYDAIGLKAIGKSRNMETDYMQAFAKSIPAEEWHRVDKNYKLEDKSMEKEKSTETDEKTTKASETETEEKTTKTEEKDTETTKSVSRKEFNELTKMVSEGFNGLTKILSKVAKGGISVEAHDKNQPDEDKETPEGQHRDVTKASAEAEDSEQPDKKKKDPEETEEAEVTTKDRSKEQKEAGENDGSDQHGTREKAVKDKENESDTYDMTTVERSIKAIEAISKDWDKTDTEDDKTTKAEEKDTESETVSKSMSSIDKFSIAVADTLARMEKSMKEQGFQTDHVAKSFISKIATDPEYQALIKGMMREPGRKRSVVMGTPFVKTRDGHMYKLVSEDHPQTKVEKSADGKNLSFKEMWGGNYASSQE